MKKILCGIAVFAFVVSMAPPVHAANDCCWDWSPGEAGAEDNLADPNTDKKPGSAPDGTAAPAGWAECTPTPKGMCFARQNRQMYWVNWTCVPGTQAPNGEMPGSGNGYQCVPKAGGGSPIAQPKDSSPRIPVNPLVNDFAVEPAVVPAVSTIGVFVLAVIILAGGTWLLKRRASSRTQAA